MMMLIKKFANNLIVGKISQGYKESEIFDVKPITDDAVRIIHILQTFNMTLSYYINIG
jgi:hypothetical protein